ncbi:MAG: hypothetical protein J5639_00090 [Bacteroidales bacterium]|nr:hypothetical protein [Bacteroidales bacterium]
MELQIHTDGKAIDRINIKGSLSTMEVGDIWQIAKDSGVRLATVQVSCSRYASTSGKRFHVSSPRSSNGMITIRRTA